MQVNETFVDLELVAIPGLGTFTTRLNEVEKGQSISYDTTPANKKKRRTVLRVVILSTLVGRRTGPLTRSCLSLALFMRSVETVA